MVIDVEKAPLTGSSSEFLDGLAERSIFGFTQFGVYFNVCREGHEGANGDNGNSTKYLHRYKVVWQSCVASAVFILPQYRKKNLQQPTIIQKEKPEKAPPVVAAPRAT